MGQLFQKIKQLVEANRYVVGHHAVERLDERRILEWQIVDGIQNAALQRERPRTQPNPSVEVTQLLADGTEVLVVWSYMREIDYAKLVTVHFLDE
ncbi:MAG: DUF4258 domain-containing protein [Phycisphaerales bacterium]|nr:MAG: DUF4258 domain-containing protein [Phycisphaerales bacterium]